MKKVQSYHNKIKKYAAVLVAFLMLSAFLLVHIGAAEGSTLYDQNKNLQSEKYTLLMKLKTDNIATPVGAGVNNYIQVYDEKLNNIDTAILQTEAAKGLIELYYQQGCAANRVAWIYFTYADLFKGEAKAAVDKVHSELQAEIAQATDAADLEELTSLSYNNKGLCARMYVASFEQKLLSLLEEGDSEAVRTIVTGENGAIKAITKCTKVTESTQYDEIYAKAKEDVTIQRNRDKAAKELIEVIGILYPDGNPEDHETAKITVAELNLPETKTARKMNAIAHGAVTTLLQQIQVNVGEYTGAYIDRLYSLLNDRINRADEADEIAEIVPIFKDFDLDFAKAQAKDALVIHVSDCEYREDAEILSLLAEYNSYNGVFDGCNAVETVAFELERAKIRADLYGEYVKDLSVVEGWIGKTELSNDLYDEYDFAKYRITRVDRDAEGAMNVCKNEYDKGVRAMAELVVEAEVRAYEPKHAEILEKSVSQVTNADKAAILAAIKDMYELSDGAQKIFEDMRTPDDLADKYVAVTKKEIDLILGNKTALRRDNAYALKDTADVLSAEGKADNLEKLTHDADAALMKAIEIDNVLDRYDEIANGEAYKSFSDANKLALEKIAREATEAIVTSQGNEGQLIGMREDAKTALNRQEGYSVIDVAATEKSGLADETQAAINKLSEDAKQAIREETNAANIKKLTEAAVFDIKQEQDLEVLRAEADAAVDAVNGMDVLTDVQKKDYVDKIQVYVGEQSERIRNAKTAEAHADEVDSFRLHLKDYLEAANAENERCRAEKKQEASDAVREAHRNTVGKIDGLAYLTDQERGSLKQAADLTLSEGLREISNAHSPTEIAMEENGVTSTFAWIVEQGEQQNEDAGDVQRSESNRRIKNKAGELLEQIGEKQYLTDEQRMALEQDVENAVIDFAGALSSVQGTQALEEAEAAAEVVLGDVSARCDAQDLEGAKAFALDQIKRKADENDAIIHKFRFLGTPEKEELKAQNAALLEDGTDRICVCENTGDTLDELAEILEEMDNYAAEAKVQENDACVAALMPFIIALAIAFGIETVALLVLFIVYKKKATGLNCLTVFLAPALMPAPLAWTLTVLLGLLDLVFAVLIVYLIIKLCRIPREEAVEEEPEEVPEELPEEAEESEKILEEEPEFYETEAVETGVVVASPRGMIIVSDGEEERIEEPEGPAALGAKPDRKALSGRGERPALGEGKQHTTLPVLKFSDLFAPKAKLPIEPKKQMVYLLPAAKIEHLQSVTVEEADRLISDEEAFSYEETNVEDTEVYTGTKKATVNVDLISRTFSNGDLVSLNTLKEKGLISQKVGHVKILGKGTLDKSLTVKAQNFSASAVKMIVLTGGSAILVEGAQK